MRAIGLLLWIIGFQLRDVVWKGMPLRFVYSSIFLFTVWKTTTTFLDALVRRVLARLIAERPTNNDEGDRNTPPPPTPTNTTPQSRSQSARPITRLEGYDFLFNVLVIKGIRYMLPAASLALGDVWAWIVRSWSFLWHVGSFWEVLLLPVVVFEAVTVRMGGWRRVDGMLDGRVGWRVDVGY